MHIDYGEILTRAWRITWSHKALWWLGLFAGAAGGGGGSWSSGYNFNSSDTGTGTSALSPYRISTALDAVRANMAIIVIVLVLLATLGIVMWVLGVAARGGLIHLVNSAEDSAGVRLAEGWRTGFHLWGRVFGVEFLTALPLIILGLVLAGFAVLVVFSAYTRGFSAGGYSQALAGLAVAGACFSLIFGLVALVLGTILAVVGQLAVRYVVLHGYRVRGGIAQGWRDLWSRRGAFVMYLVTIGTGIAFSVVVLVVLMVFGAPAVLLGLQQLWVGVALLALLALLVLMLPSAVYATFVSAMWTTFFRVMTAAGEAAAGSGHVAVPAPYGDRLAPPSAAEPAAPPAMPPQSADADA